jgi:quinolinate synthase
MKHLQEMYYSLSEGQSSDPYIEKEIKKDVPDVEQANAYVNTTLNYIRNTCQKSRDPKNCIILSTNSMIKRMTVDSTQCKLYRDKEKILKCTNLMNNVIKLLKQSLVVK